MYDNVTKALGCQVCCHQQFKLWFDQGWQVSARVSATLAETGFCRSFLASFYPKLFVRSCHLCFVLFDFVRYGAIRILLHSIALE